MGKKGWLIVVGVLAVPLAFFLWEWVLSPEARVTRTLKAVAAAAEAADADEFLSHLSEDYTDYLHPDRETLSERLREGFDRIDRLNVTLSSIDVDASGAEATARFDLVVVAIRGEERYVAVGTPFDPERLTARFEKTDRWRMTGVERGVTTPADP